MVVSLYVGVVTVRKRTLLISFHWKYARQPTRLWFEYGGPGENGGETIERETNGDSWVKMGLVWGCGGKS